MKMQKFFDEVVAVLKKDKRFVSESGELMRNAVYEAAMKMDERLLKLLYANAATKNAFFKKVGEIAVFDKQGFGWTVSNEEILKGSYTRFRNKIGLATREGDFTSVRLVPVNDDFDEIKLTNKGKDVRKYKVVGVRRSKVKVVS